MTPADTDLGLLCRHLAKAAPALLFQFQSPFEASIDEHLWFESSRSKIKGEFKSEWSVNIDNDKVMFSISCWRRYDRLDGSGDFDEELVIDFQRWPDQGLFPALKEIGFIKPLENSDPFLYREFLLSEVTIEAIISHALKTDEVLFGRPYDEQREASEAVAGKIDQLTTRLNELRLESQETQKELEQALDITGRLSPMESLMPLGLVRSFEEE